jgi:hypothetical protein
MRQAFSHRALLSMHTDADEGAPGAAVTVALCGHWEHEPPCPLAPHHVAAERVGRDLRIRILFAAEQADESEVRRRIRSALSGEWTFPEGFTTTWQVLDDWVDDVAPSDIEHAHRLLDG